MTRVSVVAPAGGEVIQLGPIQIRILEDGRTTDHRLGIGEITVPPRTPADGRPLTPENTAQVMSRYATTTATDYA